MSAFAKAVRGMSQALRTQTLRRVDGWFNAVTGLGGAKDKTTAASFQSSGFLNPFFLEVLYHEDDLAAKIADKIVREGMRQGFTVAGDEDGDIAAALRKWDIHHQVFEATIWGRVTGGAGLLLGVNQGRMDQPLELETIGEGDLNFILQLDRSELTAIDWYDDINDENFGEVRTYIVSKTSTNGTQNLENGAHVHESRIITFPGALTSQRIRIRNGGWDLSVLQRPFEILRDTNTNWRSTVLVMSDLSQAVFKVKNLIEMIAGGQKDIVQDRMEIVNMSRSLARAVIVDAELEDFSQVGAANVTGVEKLLEKTWQRLAAAADMPVTVLMGVSPAGMNATGESDMRSWFNSIRSFQENVLAPRLEDLISVVAASEGITIEDEPKVLWPSLWQMSPSEEVDHRKKIAETDKIYVDMEAVLPEEVAIGHWGSGEYVEDISPAIDTDVREERLKDELETLLNPPPPPPMMMVPPNGSDDDQPGSLVPAPPRPGAPAAEDEDEPADPEA